MSSWGIESKLRSFVSFAVDKLDAAAESLQDEDPEDNYQELVTFTSGLSRNLKCVGAAAPAELKAQIMEVLAPLWDLKTEQPGDGLRDAGVHGLRAALESLLAGPLAAAGDAAAGEEPEPEGPPDGARPDNLAEMSLQDAVTHLWEVCDKGNRVDWGDAGFTLDMQSKGRYGQDRCGQPLFATVNQENPFWSSPVTKSFIAMLDNYERETGKAEVVTRDEKQEMATFLDALGDTTCMRFLLNFLRTHAVGADPRCAKLRTMNDLQNLLFDLWLAPYRRQRKNDSSGFEHVFVGEEKRGKITGLHNWIQYYLEEKAGNIDYLGWVGKQDSDYSDDVNLVTVKFTWDDDDDEVEVKPMSTILCGSTVEFEIAILTMCFLAGNQEGDNHLTLGSEQVNVKCFPQRVRYGGAKIATAFLEIAR